MAQPNRLDLQTVRDGLAAPDGETRGRAVNTLLLALNRQPELGTPARQIFYQVATHETDLWAVTTAVTGIERLDGPDAARPYWRKLLTQPDAIAAHRAALSCVHPAHLPMMLELIDQRPEQAFRAAALNALGRMRDPAAIPALLRYGEIYDLQPAVVVALSELGDPSVIPWIRPFLQDTRHMSEMDERGGITTLGDIAADAIHGLERKRNASATPPSLPRSSAIGQTVRPVPPPLRLMASTAFQYAARGWFWKLRSMLHPSLIPVVLAGVEVAWLFFLFALYLFIAGDQKAPAINDRFVDAIGLPVPAFGLIAGVTVLLSGLTPRLWHKIVAAVGSVLCALFVVGFGVDFLTR